MSIALAALDHCSMTDAMVRRANALEGAERPPATTIAVGPHGHGSLHRVRAGSGSVERGAPCPILVISAVTPAAS